MNQAQNETDQAQAETDQARSEKTADSARGADTRYLAFVGGLLVLIIALLAVLWLRERTTRITAQKQVRTLLQQRQAVEAGMQQLMMTQKLLAIRPIDRGDMISEKGTLNGRSVTTIRISAPAGKRFGFLPGDVVVVGQNHQQPPPPSTRP